MGSFNIRPHTIVWADCWVCHTGRVGGCPLCHTCGEYQGQKRSVYSSSTSSDLHSFVRIIFSSCPFGGAVRLESFLSSQIQLFRSDEFMLLCQAFFVGLILSGDEILHRHHGEDIVIRWPALPGDHPRPKYVHRSRLPIFLDGQLKALSKTIICNIRTGEKMTTSLFQSNCRLFTKVFGVFLRVEIDTAKKVF